MLISLLGPGSDSLRDDLDAAGIEYEERPRHPKPGTIIAAAGDFLLIAQDAAPWAALAFVLRAWISACSARSVMLTTEDDRIIHIRGMSVEDIERVLKVVRQVDALDTGKRDEDEAMPQETPKPAPRKDSRKNK